MTTISVILPTYNERDNIAPLIDEILRVAIHPTNIWVVDDNSPDGTWEVVASVAKQEPRVHLIRRTDERGLTSAIARGISESDGSVVVWMDCDFSMPPTSIPGLVELIKVGTADIAVGSRYAVGGADIGHSFMAKTFSWLINFAAQIAFGFDVTDYTSGFIAAKRNVFDQLQLRGDYGEYCIDFLARAKRSGFRVHELSYICTTRRSGTSKTGVNLFDYLRRGRKYVTTIAALAVKS